MVTVIETADDTFLGMMDYSYQDRRNSIRSLKGFAAMADLVKCEREMADLATELFRVFAQFEYCLKATGYCLAGPRGAAIPDWTRFARELPPLSSEADPDVSAALAYMLRHPPRKQVVVDNALQWRVVAPQAENENDLVFLYVRRVRNNLFHGGKFNGRFFDPERSRELLEHSITILMAAILMSQDMLEAYENRTD